MLEGILFHPVEAARKSWRNSPTVPHRAQRTAGGEGFQRGPTALGGGAGFHGVGQALKGGDVQQNVIAGAADGHDAPWPR